TWALFTSRALLAFSPSASRQCAASRGDRYFLRGFSLLQIRGVAGLGQPGQGRLPLTGINFGNLSVHRGYDGQREWPEMQVERGEDADVVDCAGILPDTFDQNLAKRP